MARKTHSSNKPQSSGGTGSGKAYGSRKTHGSKTKSNAHNWHSESIDSIFRTLNSSETGLRRSDAAHRLQKSGLNQLVKEKEFSKLRLFAGQFNSFIIWILLAASLLSIIIGENVDAIVILVILLLNAIFGYVQEYKAERSLEALKRMSALKATVIRHGKKMMIDAKNIVSGDIILLEVGNKVPADARLIDASRLQVDESSLTGESIPVMKSVRQLKEDKFISERSNMVYAGTAVSKGKATAIVVETGMDTEFGKIAGMVQEADIKETPLQKKLSGFGEFLGISILGICALVFIIGLSRGSGSILEILMVSVALAVAAIPEGLPAVVTVCLALGVQRMVKKNALIRKLQSVETLGETDIICTDKTGTLTYNQMTVRQLYTNNKTYLVSGQGYRPVGEFTDSSHKKVSTSQLNPLLKCGALCNDASLHRSHNDWQIFGDPTEGALIVAAGKAGIDKELLEKNSKRVDALPFDPERKRMTTIHKEDSRFIAYVKGAPDVLINHCTKININGRIKKLTAKDREAILRQNHSMADNAMRVLGFAYRMIDDIKNNKETLVEKDLIFLGLAGMNDPPRKEVIQSINKCTQAGIRVVMITGDQKPTAVAIAGELGLGTKVMTGEELDNTRDIRKVIDYVDIYARVTPEHKLRIVEAMQSNGHIVAMTGDGVNDAPALKKADIGVAMGITGTDVSKEAADMVLTDDNFTSIVNAVEEGRTIYENIRKFIRYLITSNSGEVLTIFIAMLVGYHSIKTGNLIMPVLAIQLLWINLITDGFNAVALGLERADNDIMKKKPRKKSSMIISGSSLSDIIIIAVVICTGTLFVFQRSLPLSDQFAQTMAFTTLVVFQFFNMFNSRSEHDSIFSRNLFTNKWLWFGLLSSVLLLLAAIYTPIARFFRLVPLGGVDWTIIICIALTLVVVIELKKFILRHFCHNHRSPI